MKLYKITLMTMSLLIISSMNAKRMQLSTQIPSSEPKTFVELINFVKTSPTIWDTGNARLSEQSMSILKKGTKDANLDAAQINVLLDMISSRIPFTGNTAQDKKLAQTYMAQKEDLLSDANALTAPETKPSQEQLQAPQVNQDEITQFITQLVEENSNDLKDVFIKKEILYQLDTPDTLKPILNNIKTKYETTEAQKAIKPILINKLKETLQGISAMRWEKIEDFLDLNLE